MIKPKSVNKIVLSEKSGLVNKRNYSDQDYSDQDYWIYSEDNTQYDEKFETTDCYLKGGCLTDNSLDLDQSIFLDPLIDGQSFSFFRFIIFNYKYIFLFYDSFHLYKECFKVYLKNQRTAHLKKKYPCLYETPPSFKDLNVILTPDELLHIHYCSLLINFKLIFDQNDVRSLKHTNFKRSKKLFKANRDWLIRYFPTYYNDFDKLVSKKHTLSKRYVLVRPKFNAKKVSDYDHRITLFFSTLMNDAFITQPGFYAFINQYAGRNASLLKKTDQRRLLNLYRFKRTDKNLV